MKLLWVALAAVLLSGCAIVPASYPYAAVPEPGVNVGVGVPVYSGGYYYHRGGPYWRRWR